MNFPFLASLVLHCFLIILSVIHIKSPFSSEKLQDKGFTVFEFKEIANKSRAPVISDKEGHVSKTKAQKQDKDASTKAKKNEQNQAEKKAEEPKKKDISPQKKPNPKPQKKPKNTNKKNIGKKSDKAVVNLKRNRNTSGKADPKAKKKAFESLLNDVVAKGEAENTGVKAEEVGDTLTATQIDLIRQTLRKCWHFPAGLKNAEELVVDIRMELSKDGKIQKAEIVDKGRMQTDSDFRIAAENAYRAVMDPECNRLPLPPEKYDEWKKLELSFNPKGMF